MNTVNADTNSKHSGSGGSGEKEVKLPELVNNP